MVNRGSFFLVPADNEHDSHESTCTGSSCDVLQVMSRGVKMETLEDQAGVLRDEVSCKTSLLLSIIDFDSVQ